MLRSLLILLCIVLGLATTTVLLVSLLRIPIDLSPYRPLVESAASKALGRGVKVDGDITVSTSLWPYFEIQNLRISNPPGFAENAFNLRNGFYDAVGLTKNLTHLRRRNAGQRRRHV